MTTSVAIMQPYFVPYLGYFRLFQRTDLFVIYDCVQFPRRGYVHRNQVPDRSGAAQWLTLPLAKCDQKTLIQDLQWRADDCATFASRIRQLAADWPVQASPLLCDEWLALLADFSGSVVDYLERTLAFVCHALSLQGHVIRSSSLGLDAGLKGQDRILEICRRTGATHYVNSPGGRELYQPEVFAQAGIELQFLEPFQGSHWSVAYRLLTEEKSRLVDELSAG